MNRNNCNYGGTVSGKMSEYDKLPKAARVALQFADHNWSGEQLLKAYRRKHPQVRTAALCVAFIKQQDAAKHQADAANPDNAIMGGQR